MKQLSRDWITEGTIDFEYKKYVLLAYLQHVQQNFGESRLYPFLADLIFHYENLVSLNQRTEATEKSFRREITRLDVENMRIEFEQKMHDDEYLEEIRGIIDFAIPQIQKGVETGAEIYEEVEAGMQIAPIGILPLHRDHGYLLLRKTEHKSAEVFEFQITLFEDARNRFRGIRTSFVDSYPLTLSNTYERIKIDLIKRNQSMPNPATFAVESNTTYPFKATFFPVAKRCFMRYLANLDNG